MRRSWTSPPWPGAGGDGGEQLLAIDGVDERATDDVLDLVGLEGADEVPTRGIVAERGDLVAQLLGVVLAEVVQAGGERSLEGGERLELADADQQGFRARASSGDGGGDPLADASEVGGDIGRLGHGSSPWRASRSSARGRPTTAV
jgi:hypothetical protein